MNKKSILFIFLLRIALGSLFLYAGFTKVINSNWSAAGYLNGAKSFSGLYHWFASPANISWVNFLNEWGLTAIGFCLILGLFVRWASLGGILLMVLYYLAILKFPYVGDHSLLVDEHIIYILALALLGVARAGNFWGLDGLMKKGN
ncbi:MAG: DoxX family protein [bacterium]|nr:DoxX family protein [bacterium]